MSLSSFRKRINEPGYFIPRRFAILTTLGLSACTGAAILACNTVFLSVSKKMLLQQRNGSIVLPTSELRDLSKIAASDMQLASFEKIKVRIFACDTATCEVFGSVKSTYGALIGIPVFLNASSVDDVNLDFTAPSQKLSDVEEKMLSELKENSVISDSGKLYAIAEALATAKDSYHYVLPSISSSVCVLFGFLQTAITGRYSSFRNIPLVQKYPILFVSMALWIAIAFLLLDYEREYLFEPILDQFNEKYIDAGIEFYEKSLRRQELIRELAGSSSSDPYTIYLLRKRLSKLCKRKEELRSKPS